LIGAREFIKVLEDGFISALESKRGLSDTSDKLEDSLVVDADRSLSMSRCLRASDFRTNLSERSTSSMT